MQEVGIQRSPFSGVDYSNRNLLMLKFLDGLIGYQLEFCTITLRQLSVQTIYGSIWLLDYNTNGVTTRNKNW